MKENKKDNSDKEDVLPTASRLTPEEESIFSAPPPKIKGYHIISALGEGGFGVVYLAEQQKPVKRRVALKVLKPGMDSKQVIARFEAEEQALALLDHPNVAQVYEAGMTEEGRSYFAMEYVKGVPITEHCDRNKLSIEDRLKLFLQVCDAIGHAHQKGIIHRDIKPSNILVSIHGENVIPKVIDFGVAKAISQPLTERTLFTEQGQLIGTPEYMSPEQAEMTAQDVDTRTDIYSLGVLLYELLTGVLPFDPKTLRKEAFNEIQRIIREQDPPRPSVRLSSLGEDAKEVADSRRTEVETLVRRLHKELEWIPLKAMRKERMHRYRSASELADDVQNYLNGAPLIAGPESAVYRVKKFVRRNRALVTGVAAVLVVLVAGIAVSTILAIEQARARVEADKARKIAEQAEKAAKEEAEARRRSLYFNSIALAEATSRHGHIGGVRKLLESCPADLRGWEWDRLRHISDQAYMTIRGHKRGPSYVSFSPDGKRIVSCGSDHNIKLWDSATGAELMTLRGHEGSVWSARFSPDGKRIISTSRDGTFVVWDADSGEELMTFRGHEEWRGASFSPDGKRIVSTSRDGTIKVWDANSGGELITLPIHDEWPWLALFNPDGTRIFSGCGDETIKGWDATTGAEVMTFEGHKGWVISLAFSPDGKRIVSGSTDNAVKVWDVTTGEELMTLRGHRATVKSVAFSSDSKRIVSSGSWDNMIKVWDTASGEELITLRGHLGHISHAEFSPDGKRVVSCGDDSTIKLWDVSRSDEGFVLYGNKGVVDSIAFSLDGERIISGSGDGTIKVWELTTGAELITLRGHGAGVVSVAFSPDGQRIVSGSEDKTVKVWDVASGTEVMTLHGHGDSIYSPYNPVASVAFSPDGRRVVSGSWDKTIKVWDAISGEELMTLTGHKGAVDCVAFSPDGKRIVSGGSDEKIKIWDATSGDEVMTLPGHSYWVYSVSFSPDGKRIISSGDDGTIKFWDALTGAKIMTTQANYAYRAEFSPDGKRIISFSTYDRTVKVWDAATGVEAMTLQGHKSSVSEIAFSPDGKTVALGYRDGSITLLESATPAKGYGPRRTAEAARKVIDQLYEKHGFYREVIDKLQVDETLDESVRGVALQIANARRWEDVDKLNKESWEVVSLPDKSIEDYQLALEKAEKAKSFEPDNWSILNTLGVAKYRVGAYEDSLVALTNSDKMRIDANQEPDSTNAAFTAMALHQLGRAEDAQVALDRLRGLFEKEELADDKNAQGFLIEAEKLFAGENSKLYLAWESIEADEPEEATALIEELRSLSRQKNTKIVKQIEGAVKWLGRAFYNRAKNSWRHTGEYGEIITEYEAVLRVDPCHAGAFNDLAWLRATCPAAEFRDGAKAVEEATKACELTNWEKYDYISILAAACSEAGDFTAAVKWQEEAIDLLPEYENAKLQANYEARLKLFQSNQPYHKGSRWSFSVGELVAWWKFDEAENGNVIDSSGNDLHGRLMGNAQIVSDPKRGNVLSLDGDGYVDCGKNLAFDITGTITVVCWIKVNAFDKDWQSIVSRGEYIWKLTRHRDKNGIAFSCTFVKPDGSMWIGSGHEWWIATGGRVEVNDGKWHHVAGVYDGRKIYLYVDAMLDDYTNVQGILATSDYPVYIGGDVRALGSEWNGLIDDVRIYSYALNEAEIKALYTGKEPPLRKE